MKKVTRQTTKNLSWFTLLIVAAIGFSIVYQPDHLTKREKYEQFLIEKMSQIPQYSEEQIAEMDKPTQPDMAALQDFFMTLDPETGTVPRERRHEAYQQVLDMKQSNQFKSTNSMEWNGTSSEMGGRTRAIMWDPNDASGNKVWAGGVTGGLWYRDDITNDDVEWQPVDEFWSSLNISCITYDPNDPMTFYVGTGEAQTAVIIYRESTGVGDGIWTTDDGGETWSLMETTTGFEYITDIKVRDEDGTSVIYAAVVSGDYRGVIHQSEPSDGLFRSEDSGETWDQVLPDIPGYGEPYAVADIEFGADGRIYVGTMQNVEIEGGATILFSDEGDEGTWTVYNDYVPIIESHSTYNIPARVMLAAAPSDENIIYAAIAAGNYNGFNYYRGRYIIKSTDKGENWSQVSIPQNTWATLAWHAFIIKVDPNDPNRVFTGGLDMWKSINGGNSWNRISDWALMYYGGGDDYLHADQHAIEFKPGSSDEFITSDDGGVFYTSSATMGAPVFEQKNQGYNTLQFYTCDIYPEEGTSNFVGGLQDNGTLLYQDEPLSINHMIDGGDGAYCFIDDNEPTLWITSVYYNAYTFWLNYGPIEGMDTDDGIFINPADYDSDLNILYANATSFFGSQSNNILRIDGIPENPDADYLNLQTGLNVYYSHVTVSPRSPEGTTNLFVGSQNGRVFKVINAQSSSFEVEEITDDNFPTAYVSCVAVGQTEDRLLVTFSNYGVESVWQTIDGGGSWENVSGNMPDIPIRWALYHPENDGQALLATEIGVWSTNMLNQPVVTWTPDVAGMANVRVDMLRIREVDNTVVAATHGRGCFTSYYPLDPFTSVPENSGSDMALKIFPNPTTGSVTVTTKHNTGSDGLLTILDMSGKIVLETRLYSNEQTLDVSSLSKGSYVVTVAVGGKSYSERLIVR